VVEGLELLLGQNDTVTPRLRLLRSAKSRENVNDADAGQPEHRGINPSVFTTAT